MTYVTDEVRALIGSRGPRRTAAAPLSADSLRRFVQAVMEPDQSQDEHAPPLWPMHAFTRAAGTADPFDRFAERPDWDATDPGGLGGLPRLDIPLQRLLNGGTAAEFVALARVGDTVSAQAEYLDITEREGRSGPMVIVKVRTTYTNQDDQVLARITNTIIRR